MLDDIFVVRSLVRNNSGIYIVAGIAVSVFMLGITHKLSNILTGLFISIYLPLCSYLSQASTNKIIKIAISASIGALGTSFVTLPMIANAPLVQTEFLQMGPVNYKNWFVFWPAYPAPLWGVLPPEEYTAGSLVGLNLAYVNIVAAPRLSIVQAFGLTYTITIYCVWLAKQKTRS